MKHDRIVGEDGRNTQRRPRIGVALLCEVRQGTRPWKTARLDDLSPGGFRISHMPDARPEVPLRIRIPGIQLLSARICWERDGAIGCEFAEPLHVAVFEHIVKAARGA
ncbi:PilZ domain-containing protein [Novosphingobium album (ex Liu et al. 2023)]|uniref:PilZ domain-containing protein n=1 Tax=Novosphingobium album (ex Liu et al. 2023) TaxID=3031130 RepID=A0ABT5WRM2_9SPHN|nr:PilZ domain-containing protein [Novosphingobium album (ex Liu et al. 2023)]MDE8651912.1 PilZ domain-containing protein [Novosphingobium album (ex Liu et al. 2023)]